MPLIPKYQVFTATATDDNPFSLTTLNLWMKEIDIFIYTQDAYVGDLTEQIVKVAADDVYTILGPVCVKDIFFKNQNAGQNTVVVLGGTILSDRQMIEGGLIA